MKKEKDNMSTKRFRALRKSLCNVDSTCHWCKKTIGFWNSSVDHFFSKFDLERYTKKNKFVLSCLKCNNGRQKNETRLYHRFCIECGFSGKGPRGGETYPAITYALATKFNKWKKEVDILNKIE